MYKVLPWFHPIKSTEKKILMATIFCRFSQSQRIFIHFTLYALALIPIIFMLT